MSYCEPPLLLTLHSFIHSYVQMLRILTLTYSWLTSVNWRKILKLSWPRLLLTPPSAQARLFLPSECSSSACGVCCVCDIVLCDVYGMWYVQKNTNFIYPLFLTGVVVAPLVMILYHSWKDSRSNVMSL